jgi:TolA-binding protein
MTDSPSVAEQVSAAVETAVAKHSESPSQDGGTTNTATSQAGEAPAPAGASGPEASPTAAVSQDARDGATRQPDDADGEDVKDDSKWKELDSRRTILKNARSKGAAEFRSNLEQRLGFSLDDENTLANVAMFRQDPAGYIKRFAQHFGLQAPEQAQRPQPTAPNGKTFERPSPRLRAEDGTPAYAQPEVDALIDHLTSQIQELKGSIDPLQQMRQQMEQQSVMAQAHTEAARTFEEIKTLEGFEDVKDRMLSLMKADGRVTWESAYRRAYQEIYRPKLEQSLRQRALDDLKKAPVTTPKGPSPNAQPRGVAPAKRGGLSVAEAIQAAVEKHSATA